ncbi:glycosylphosphatidylinositol-alpha 1,4 mannosyltransferase I NDAI_0C02980 [Naumovozyma dairenensis CBS 421]|uniref:GPI mannosyltransferase 1 n=1 Tax=Naumovozyma dairenensis (strain ATCC 10597 / BCRC 20456 / CBS 421 / NBRC 0211 / NRRL Y-12639) TaxID=1071378 RepID=G0W847_NAUDC|nr:hypothetical protein NDAI_0C02980 [Naumovozyma dairenensis CBS 421]CCD23958.1 hypothetical protein NDAI_0C02980 [Naumovozyma dairenensis CBS 421]
MGSKSSQFVNGSPYQRDTYRYTPLLSWLLVPNHYFGWFHLGKLFFVIYDLLTGILLLRILRKLIPDISDLKLTFLGSIWLLNPMVITISTRGNAESLLCFFIMLSLYYLQEGHYWLAGVIYGLSIHFKIYPIIYCSSMAIYIFYNDSGSNKNQTVSKRFKDLFVVGVSTLMTIILLGFIMYYIYGYEFLDQAYFYHLYRTDHRHNFSLWNMLLYYDSAKDADSISYLSKMAFLPQLLIVFPLSYLEWINATFMNLVNVIFLQTFAFVIFNKVCTSQYFIWYLVFLPIVLSRTTITGKKGIMMLFVWVLTQAFWLSQGYYLEFEGKNAFYPGIFFGAVSFFIGNVWILGQFISDAKEIPIDTCNCEERKKIK